MRVLLLLISFLFLVCLLSLVDCSVVRTHLAFRTLNSKELENSLYAISDPRSEQYGQYLSLQQIADISSPSHSQCSAIIDWLSSRGCVDISLSAARDYISATVPALLAEQMFDSSAFASMPNSHLIHFAFRDDNDEHEANKKFIQRTLTKKDKWHFNVRQANNINKADKADNDANAINVVNARPLDSTQGTPANQLSSYGVPAGLSCINSSNSQMVWGTGTYGFVNSDLDEFYSLMNIPANEDSYLVHSGYMGTPGGDNFGEATLDITLISSLAPGIKSLCSNTDNSSNSEWSTGFGPALLHFAQGLMNSSAVPNVISMSLGSLSWDSCNLLCEGVANSGQGYSYSDCTNYMIQQRQVCMYPSSDQVDHINDQFMKLGLRGVSLLAATGDGGSHFSFQQFPNDAIGTILNTVSCQYNLPTFPAESPWVTGVGGTDWSLNGPSAPVAWSASGGGFSWRYPMPAYQVDAVNAYMKSQGSALPPSTSYNATNRAYPDVAALAVNVPIVMDGSEGDAGGTSCSAPEFSALVSLINDHRLNNNLPVLGFLNTRLYSAYAVNASAIMYDMSYGNSNCESAGNCCSSGFAAAVGWDPTTGLGSPIFTGLLAQLGNDQQFKQ